jgi:hypothetical protein
MTGDVAAAGPPYMAENQRTFMMEIPLQELD